MAGPASSSTTIYAVKEELCYSSQMDRLFSSVIMDFWMHGEISSLLITNKDSGRNHKQKTTQNYQVWNLNLVKFYF